MVKVSRYLKIGPGGRNCSCCFPAPNSKDRRARYRIAKRKAEREAMRNAEEDMIDHWAMLEEAKTALKEFYNEDCWESDFEDWTDDWTDDRFNEEEDYNDHDTYYDPDDYSGNGALDLDDYDYISRPSEQEKVAKAMSIALMGDEVDWRQHLTNAKRFMEAMKRNDQ